ncbi:MAG: ribosomal protein S18-alanine N-acetyltransferase [Clostridia bacterium]
MIVKRCTSEDIDKIYDIEVKSFSDPLKKETMISDLKRESYYCYGLFDGDFVAFLCYEKVLDEGQIISVAVHPDYRRKGYGKELFERVIEIAKNDSVKFFTLEVRANNYPAIALYESLGFKKVGIRKNYYSNPVCDGVLMDLCFGKD